jgi:hypothetical protein
MAWCRGAGKPAHAQDILVPPDKKAKIKPQSGQVVMVEIIEQPSKFSQPIGKIIEVLGNYADPGMEIEIALRKHDLPFEFSKAALEENKALPDKVKKADLIGREDLRDLPLVTIDGETARDFDDAVFARRRGAAGAGGGDCRRLALRQAGHGARQGGDGARQFGLFPAPGDSDAAGEAVERHLFAESRCRADGDGLRHGDQRGRQDRQIPLLPGGVPLQGAADLQPGVVVACPARRSRKARCIARCSRTARTSTSCSRCCTRRAASAARSTSRRPKRMMLFNDQGKIENIVPVVRNDAHRMIEECMLAANVCASDFPRKAQADLPLPHPRRRRP